MKPDDLFASTPFEEDLERARLGDLQATVRVGYKYFTGSSGRFDLAKAESHFQQASTQSVTGSAWLGYLYVKCRRKPTLIEQGISMLKQAVDSGDPTAQALLGRVYERGLGGVTKDVQSAQSLYETSAPQFALARTFYGELLWKQGKHAAAINAFESASAVGETTSMLALADVHLRNFGTQPRVFKAKHYLRMAAMLGDHVAMFRLAIACRDHIGADSSDTPSRAFTLLHRSAQSGYAPAQNATGKAYGDGIGVHRSPSAQRFWTLKANAANASAIWNRLARR